MNPLSEKLNTLRYTLNRVVLGQEAIIDGILIALLCNGHILLEGRPGLGKTRLAQALANCLGGSFARIQFTPDLMPSDILGYQTYLPDERKLALVPGPVETNWLLADELNRAPAKVQSALLEAMQERQITIAGTTRILPQPFLVIATQNPQEEYGTYPLPNAEKDRFLLSMTLDYPPLEAERKLLQGEHKLAAPPVPLLTADEIHTLQRQTETIHADARILDYILALVQNTRNPPRELNSPPLIEQGASPRGSLALLAASRAYALLNNRSFVRPDDVQAMAPYTLAHRIALSYRATRENLPPVQLIRRILHHTPAP